MWAALALDAACALEISTAFFPALFLPLASVANVGTRPCRPVVCCTAARPRTHAGKNVAWLSASAARASIHKGFLREENLADVTAKAGAQSIASSLAGTGLGIALSAAVGSSMPHVGAVFAVASAIHIYCNYRSLCEVALPSLDLQRCERLALHFLRAQGAGAAATAPLPTPDELRLQENFVRPYRSPLRRSSELALNPPLDAALASADELHALRSQFEGRHFWVHVRAPARQPARVALFVLDGASADEVLLGALLAMRVRADLDAGAGGARDTGAALAWLDEHGAAFLAACRASGWQTEHLLLESVPSRLALAPAHERAV